MKRKFLVLLFASILLLAACVQESENIEKNNERESILKSEFELANQQIESLEKQLDEANEKILELENAGVEAAEKMDEQVETTVEETEIKDKKEIAKENAQSYPVTNIDTYTNEEFIDMEYYFEGIILGFGDDTISVLDEGTNYVMEIKVDAETISELYIPEYQQETGPRAGNYIEVYGVLDGNDYDNSQSTEGANNVKGLIIADEIYIYG